MIKQSLYWPDHLFTWDIFVSDNQRPLTIESADYRKQLGWKIVKHFERILKTGIYFNNPIAVENILKTVDPKELLADYDPGMICRSCRNYEDQLMCWDILVQLKREIWSLYYQMIHDSIMYIIDKKTQKGESIESISSVLEKIKDKLPEWDKTVEWFQNTYDRVKLTDNFLWKYWPESKQTQTGDFLGQAPFIFALIGLFRQVEMKYQPIPTKRMNISDQLYTEIKNHAQQIASNKQWIDLIGDIDEDTLKRFEKALENSQKANEK